MKVKQNIGFFECLKARISIDVYELIRLIIICVAPIILYGLFALAYWGLDWGKNALFATVMISGGYVALGIFWGCCNFYDVHVDILTERTHDHNECLSQKATKKLFSVHTFLLMIGIIVLLATGLTLEIWSLMRYYQHGASCVWVSICICIAPAVVNISFFFLAVLIAWQNEKGCINNELGKDKTRTPRVCQYCKCMDCFSHTPSRIEEKDESGSYTDVVDKVIGTANYNDERVDIVKSVCEDVGYKYHMTYRFYACRNCGKENIRIDDRKIY